MLVNLTLDRICNRDKPLAGDIVVHRIKNFDLDTGKEIFDSLNKAILLGQQIFPVIIDSYGGQVYSLFSCIEAFQSSPIPVATVIEGKAMSCGAFLAGMGTIGYRFIGKNSHILIHHVSNYISGIAPQIKEDSKHTEEIDNQIFSMLSKHCGHNDKFFIDKLKPKEGADWYIKPEEALSLNLVDYINSPTLTINIKTEWKIS